MPLATIRLRPGIDVEQTPVLNAAGISSANLVRFRDGLPEKLGGWTHMNTQPIVGTGRGMHAWADLSGNPYIAVGTEQRLQLFTFGTVFDITPLRQTTNPAVNFSTVINTPTVTIVDTAHGASTSDWVVINVPVSVGGIVLQGFYQIASVVDANTYTVTAASNATSTVSNGGAVPSLAAVNTQANITVTLNNHGLAAGALFTIEVGLTVGGIVIASNSIYSISSPTTNTFVIAPGPSASSTQTLSENSGNAQFFYLVPTGYASNTALTGYGIGDYGSGDYGIGSGTQTAPLRQWFLDNWGQDLIGNYNGSPIYVWTPPLTDDPADLQGNVALAINATNYPGASNPPKAVNESFVSMPQQIMVALGVEPVGGSTQDPNLIRWSDVADFTDWTATAVNQAGSFRLPSGSRIVGGIQGPLFGVISTDVDVWVMQYIQPPLVFGFNKIAFSADWISAHCAGIFNTVCYWLSRNNFMYFDGNSVQTVPCPVWDAFFQNLNMAQQDKIHCAVNSWFGEITWYYCSAASNEIDSYVTYCARESQFAAVPIWTMGKLVRTTWVDDNVYGAPIGVDTAGLLQQHEISPDADGSAMNETLTTGFFQLQDGNLFNFVERVLADFKMTGASPSVSYEILTSPYGTDPVTTYGPFTYTPTSPEYSIVRGRGRFVALKITGSPLGTWWRLGGLKALFSSAGRRP
jgi:hypothetical protein